MNRFNEFVASSPGRPVMPIAVYPGLAITRAHVGDIVSNAQAQAEAVIALHERYRTPVVLSAMDLSAEAEAFGCEIHLSDNEVPSVTGRLVTGIEQARALPLPQPGDKRTAVHLEAVRLLRALPDQPLVLGGCIGPFSLAARLVGVSEAMVITLTEPELMHVLLEKCAAFLIAYVEAFKRAGADGVIMAEPAAGLLSPKGVIEFSANSVRAIADATDDGRFALILHNCGAKLVHLAATLQSGVKAFHFGAPMDLPGALAQVADDVVLCGNLDPAGLFCHSTPDRIREEVKLLLDATTDYRNFVLSSGCDLPPNTPLANLDAFIEALNISTTSQKVREEHAAPEP